MGVSARIVALLVIVSAANAGPVRELRLNLHHHHTANSKDLLTEPSEFVQEISHPTKYSHALLTETGEVDHSSEQLGGSQTFFPSFANLFESRQNNLRIGFGGNQEAAYSQRPNSYKSLFNYPVFGNFRNSFENYGKPESSQPAAAPLVDQTSGILGSGNFGIIRGGTFHAHNDEDEYDGFSTFYNNGHGRPSLSVGYIANPRPNYNQDQFANFRDFADINTPANSAYSNYVVVYANKNATKTEVGEDTKKVVARPNNIIETLDSLDRVEDYAIKPKLSKAKVKLAITNQKLTNKKNQWKKTNSKYFAQKSDLDEPLLALS